ncbi:hypothetical protein CW304_23250 [Bacillus sp. UFRGS-B20]|nr:hypothetical protein CW304_23250 [Bacillus sp. UFRGS-B20]
MSSSFPSFFNAPSSHIKKERHDLSPFCYQAVCSPNKNSLWLPRVSFIIVALIPLIHLISVSIELSSSFSVFKIFFEELSTSCFHITWFKLKIFNFKVNFLYCFDRN